MTVVSPDPEALKTRELSALWRAAFGEPPVIAAPPDLLAHFLVQCLPPAPPYEIGANPLQPSPSARQAPVVGSADTSLKAEGPNPELS